MRIFVLLLIVGLCLTNAFLIKQNRDLKATVARLRARPEVLRPGSRVPPFTGNLVSGQQRTLNYADRPKTVLMAFSTQCAACERALPYWRAIEAVSRRNQYQVFGISLDGGTESKQFLESKGLAMETFVNIDPDMREIYKLSLAPLTIVIDSTGHIDKIWPGNFNRETKKEVEEYFGITVDDDLK